MDGVENSRMYVNGGCSSDQLTHFPSSSTSHLLESLWIQNPSSSINDPSMVNFHDYDGRSLPAPESNNEVGEGEDDVSSETEGMRNPYRRPEKKRRLSPEQVKKLERCFEVETKLEPERKVNIAKELSLQPRQVAIWFQNRRARFKTKQLEKEYDSLQANFESLKSDFDDLVKEKERLQNEVSVLTNKLKQKEKTGFAYPVQVEAEKEGVVVPPYKQEDASSAKSDVSDSESPHCNEGNYKSAIEEVAVKPEWSELPPERIFRPVAEYGFGDVFEVHGSGCHLGLTGVEDQSNYWPWLY